MTENNKKNIAPFYLCTGFHRSGTSLMAQSLAHGGMHMGDDLMGASFSNALGHVEDMPIVRLHDKILDINGSDWRYNSSDLPLVVPKWFTPFIQRYMASRTENNDICGVKDPRATLFLNHWQHAAPDSIRYVLVYRHWASSCYSLLNRASKHLISGTAPMLANKVNMGFWQQPDLAFNMWLINNQAILSFYQQHPEKCLLISQDALINNNASVARQAHKIGLARHFFSDDLVDHQLMSDSVPEYVLNMPSVALKLRLEQTWQALQRTADVTAAAEPTIKASTYYPQASDLGYVDLGQKTIANSPPMFRVDSLSWSEATGFISEIKDPITLAKLCDAMLVRPFAAANVYRSLAQIAHKQGLYFYTKLCKMRAMYVDQQRWQVSKWRLFVDDDSHWIVKPDNKLPQANPFSLRPADQLEIDSSTKVNLVNEEWQTLFSYLSSLEGVELQVALQNVLLYRYIDNIDQYLAIAQLAREEKLATTAEFALIKALRLEYRPMIIMALGDIYFGCNAFINALHCFEEANGLEPEQAPIIARLANVSVVLGDRQKALAYLARAQQLAPHNRAVKASQNRMDISNREQPVKGQHQVTESQFAFRMPLVESYKEVLDLTQKDRRAGAALDKYNQQMAFLLRDNKQWLLNGIKPLPPLAADCLTALLYQNWRRLWPETSLRAALQLPLGESITDLASNKQSALLKIAFVIHIAKVDGLREILAFIDHCPYNADLLVSCSLENKTAVIELCADYRGGTVFIESFDDELSHLQSWLTIHQSRCQGYGLICKLHDLLSVNDTVEVKNWRLQLLFSLLGTSDLIETIVSNFVNNRSLGVVVPAYHPVLAESLISEVSSEPLNTLIEELGLAEAAKVVAFPAGGMFWYRPETFRDLLSSITRSCDQDDVLKLLPLVAMQNGYTSQCCHLLS